MFQTGCWADSAPKSLGDTEQLAATLSPSLKEELEQFQRQIHIITAVFVTRKGAGGGNCKKIISLYLEVEGGKGRTLQITD